MDDLTKIIYRAYATYPDFIITWKPYADFIAWALDRYGSEIKVINGLG